MYQAILVHADIHEGAKGGDVGYDARQLHARTQVLDLIYALCKAERLKRFARVTARLC